MLFILSLSLVNSVSVRAARVVLPLYALELGAQPLTVGILAAAFSAFPMLLAVAAGRLADRFGSRWLLVFGAGGGGLAMLVPYFLPGLAGIFIAVAMIGLSDSISNVALQNLVGLLSNPDTRARNFSNYSLMEAFTGFLGPLIAGFSIEQSGHATACLYLALLTLFPVAMLVMRGRGLPGGTRQTTRVGGSVRNMLSEPGVRRVLAVSSLQTAGKDLYQFYMPVYTHTIGLSPSAIGIVLAMNAAAAFVVRSILPRLINWLTEEKVLTYGFFIGAACLMLIPMFQRPAILALISFTFGLGMGCSAPLVTMMMFSQSRDGRSGEALGLRMTVSYFTKLVGPVIFGSIGSAFGLFPMFWLNALMLASGGVVSRSGRDRAGGHR